ncbi:uncharacterized protein LOC144139484 [Haemaphysalis longicornis]
MPETVALFSLFFIDELTETECPSGIPSTLREAELVGPSPPSLVASLGINGCVTDAVHDGTTACTATEDNRCWLFKHLATWNESLLPARLQLREACTVRPQLSLVTRSMPYSAEPPLEIMRTALMCASFLLKSHRCIVAVDLSSRRLVDLEAPLLEALQESSWMKYLKIPYCDSNCCKKLCKVLVSMKQVEELEIECEEASALLQKAISTLVRSSQSLKALRIHLNERNRNNASVLLGAVIASSSLNELSLNDCVLSSVGPEYRSAFKKYLGKSATLTTFEFVVENPWLSSESTLNSVLYGLLRNKTIRILNLTEIPLDCKTSRILSTLFEKTECLRCVKFISKSFGVVTDCCNRQDSHSQWILALACSKTLEKVTLPMHVCDVQTWMSFLEVLSSSKSTMKVILEAHFNTPHYIERLCKALREKSLDGIVSISRQLFVDDRDVLKCKAISNVSLCLEVPGNIDHWPVLDELQSCKHITSVELRITWQHNDTLFVAIAAYLETTITLKELCFCTRYPKVPQKKDFRLWSLFTNALTRNTRIRQIDIRVIDLDERAGELLADALNGMKSLWRVCLYTGDSARHSAFVRHLCIGIANNFTMLDLTLFCGELPEGVRGEWFVVDETLKRNCDLLTRAAQFATNALRGRFEAQALERMHRHAALPEKLMRVATVESAHAASMIRRAFRSIESLDGFMRLSGVVKERVVCLPSSDGRPQLDDLNEYCWRRVRRYLHLGDVHYSGLP